jgi:hypothetical protein
MADDETNPDGTTSAETTAAEHKAAETGADEPAPAGAFATAAAPVMTWPTPPEPEGPEIAMLQAAALGEPFLANAGKPDSASPVIRGAILYRLLVEADWPVHPKGVQLQGVHISGDLDLEGAPVRCALRMHKCSFDKTATINLTNATVSQVTLSECDLSELRGDTLRVTQNLVLNGSTFTGPLMLQGADIAGNLDCTGAKLGGGCKLEGAVHSLYADGLKVGGRVRLNLNFTAENTVWLRGAHVGGNLNCRDARLNGSDSALCCDGIRVEGNLYLQRALTFRGMVDLRGADIGGELDCNAAVLRGRGGGYSMFAEWLRVGGPVRLSSWTDQKGNAHPFGASGTVWLLGADITANLNCRNAVLAGARNAISVERAKVGGNVIAANMNVPTGKITLVGAQIAGNLTLTETKLDGTQAVLQADRVSVGGDVLLGSTSIPHGSVALPGAEIAGKLQWTSAGQVQGMVDLRYAKAGQLEDDWTKPNACWPVGGRLKLVGFSYDSISGSDATVDQRLAWIRSQWTAPRSAAAARSGPSPDGTAKSQDTPAGPGQATAGPAATSFAAQPYEQLASVYQQAGQEKEARAVAIERRRDLRRYGNLTPYRRAIDWLLDRFIQYGYQTWRAIGMLAGVYVIAVAVYWAAEHYGTLIVPVMATKAGAAAPSALDCTKSYPCFYPAGYAIDTVIPIINVHQADYWGPNGHSQFGHALVVFTWITTLLGWALATLAVAGFTGIARSSDNG